MGDYVITRKAELCGVGKCKYVILCNPQGGILNDPILLRPYENEWWFSLADSDINMYLQGVNHDGKFNCEIAEIDVAPVQIQGPKSSRLMDDAIPHGTSAAAGTVPKGTKMSEMKYYDCVPVIINGCEAVVTASGF